MEVKYVAAIRHMGEGEENQRFSSESVMKCSASCGL